MDYSPSISYLVAFWAGFLSFVSPCVLPLVPSYISYITGISIEELVSREERDHHKWLALKNATMFILGFSMVFIFFGASATVVGQLFLTYQDVLRKVGGAIVILFGLYTIGFLKFRFLMQEKRFHFQEKPAGYFGSLLVGVAFAAGWTPCVGPILGTILFMASDAESVSTGVQLLAAYSLGLGIPLLAIAFGIHSFLNYFKQLNKYMGTISAVSGVFLIVIGLMIFTNSFALFTAFLQKNGIGWDLTL
ncbi:MAG TPA: cytochrome c biogenesis protein CcdA [Nitrospiria bacterium]|jgi:cytochrome c-type biogenesis protein